MNKHFVVGTAKDYFRQITNYEEQELEKFNEEHYQEVRSLEKF